jgi:hypothetical protein
VARLDALKVVSDHLERSRGLLLSFSLKTYADHLVKAGERSEQAAQQALGGAA